MTSTSFKEAMDFASSVLKQDPSVTEASLIHECIKSLGYDDYPDKVQGIRKAISDHRLSEVRGGTR